MASATATETKTTPPWFRKPAPLSFVPKGFPSLNIIGDSTATNATTTTATNKGIFNANTNTAPPAYSQAHNCASCGCQLDRKASSEAYSKVEELESQISQLNQRATEYVTRIADYEEEIAKLHRKQKETEAAYHAATSAVSAPLSPPADISSPPPSAIPDPHPTQSAGYTSAFSYFLSRKTPSTPPPSTATTAQLQSPQRHSGGPSNEDLQRALTEEKQLRQEAESKVSKISGELDELSAALFMQANEMVASERQARMKLEKRVAELEQRDREKMARLQNIERAVDRINRVRNMLAPTISSPGPNVLAAEVVAATLKPKTSTSSLSSSIAQPAKQMASVHPKEKEQDESDEIPRGNFRAMQRRFETASGTNSPTTTSSIPTPNSYASRERKDGAASRFGFGRPVK